MPAPLPPYRPAAQASVRYRRQTEPSVPLHRSPTLAAILSFLIPGLGQIVSGRVRRGLLFLVPFLVLLLLALLALAGDRARLVGFLVRPEVLIGVFVLNLLLLIWRGIAILDAWRGTLPGRVRLQATSTVVVAVLVLLAFGTHAVLGGYTYLAYDAETSMFGGSGFFGTLDGSPGAPTDTLEPGTTAQPTIQPVAQPLADGRLDILLVGADAGPGRWSLRTDTLIVLSVDVNTGRSALFGIPRNLIAVPLPAVSRAAFACGCFPDLINALYVYASGHPKYFPGTDDTRGLLAVQGAISQLTGLQLDGMVVVKLNGFVSLVDAIGGIDVNVPYAIHDNHYPLENGKGYIVLNISKGLHHFNGSQALAYARSRHQDSDYGRMQRQQLTLTVLAKALTSASMIAKVPDLLGIAKTSLWTNLNIDDLSQFLELAARADITHMAHITFIPPKYPEILTASEIKRIQTVTANTLTTPLPTPTPSPSPKPSPAPSGSP
jgi:LCP family protein required for cell wall assembly